MLMKHLLVALLFLLPFTLLADTTKEQKVVFDCSSDDFEMVSSKLWLIKQTLLEYEEKKTPYKMLFTIHSHCTEVVVKEHAKEDKTIQKIQKRLEELSEKYGVDIEVCAIALDSRDILKKDILPFVSKVRNSLTHLIELQNDGYAYFPIK